MNTWCIGSIGFAYDDWAGVFFPPGLAVADRLSYYATQFSGIELDTTFYAIPPLERFRRWSDQVPDDFVFALKAPQELTHSGRDLVQNLSLWEALVDGADMLGFHRSILLLQFPPHWDAQHLDELARFLDLAALPCRIAVEFRHASWWSGAVNGLLQSKGVAWVAADLAPAAEAPITPDDPEATYRPYPPMFVGPWSYLRLCGQHGQFPQDAAEVYNSTPRLTWWLEQWEPQPFNFATVGNSYAGYAIATLDRLAPLVGVSSRIPAQPTLF